MQIPILNGIFTGTGPDVRTAYPVNLVPTPIGSGISTGYLRPADGIVTAVAGPGVDRGGIEWRGVHYRVMGTELVTVAADAMVTVLGDVGGSDADPVTIDYGFDRLAIVSGGQLFYWNGSLTQVTDPDLGVVTDVVWVDGYFMTTDGTSLVVTELNDPTQVNPLKYGSSEADPDPVVALLKVRNEVYAVNRHTIEVFDNVGGEFFPFQRVEGAQIEKGAVGTHACCLFADAVAFLGSGFNEPVGVYVGANSNAVKLSTQEIDQILLQYTEEQLSKVKLESRVDRAHQYLYVHLPDRTLVYDGAATQALGQQIWFVLTSSVAGFSQYRARNMTWAHGRWYVGDPQSSSLGVLDDSVGGHWGNKVRWEFSTAINYNEGRGALFHQIELVTLNGRADLNKNPIISTSYSVDGESWGQSHPIRVGTVGDRLKRLCWFRQGHMRNWRVQRFQGDSDARASFLRLEAQLEPLVY